MSEGIAFAFFFAGSGDCCERKMYIAGRRSNDLFWGLLFFVWSVLETGVDRRKTSELGDSQAKGVGDITIVRELHVIVHAWIERQRLKICFMLVHTLAQVWLHRQQLIAS